MEPLWEPYYELCPPEVGGRGPVVAPGTARTGPWGVIAPVPASAPAVPPFTPHGLSCEQG